MFKGQFASSQHTLINKFRLNNARNSMMSSQGLTASEHHLAAGGLVSPLNRTAQYWRRELWGPPAVSVPYNIMRGRGGGWSSRLICFHRLQRSRSLWRRRWRWRSPSSDESEGVWLFRPNRRGGFGSLDLFWPGHWSLKLSLPYGASCWPWCVCFYSRGLFYRTDTGSL